MKTTEEIRTEIAELYDVRAHFAQGEALQRDDNLAAIDAAILVLTEQMNQAAAAEFFAPHKLNLPPSSADYVHDNAIDAAEWLLDTAATSPYPVPVALRPSASFRGAAGLLRPMIDPLPHGDVWLRNPWLYKAHTQVCARITATYEPEILENLIMNEGFAPDGEIRGGGTSFERQAKWYSSLLLVRAFERIVSQWKESQAAEELRELVRRGLVNPVLVPDGETRYELTSAGRTALAEHNVRPVRPVPQEPPEVAASDTELGYVLGETAEYFPARTVAATVATIDERGQA
ncbi:hypothetical protein DB346_08595 [Verrucomicrobia bacterium LW23]|nr:hypothetical protein DB346_08595 [Verrucomicrobia bacterium LW23]